MNRLTLLTLSLIITIPILQTPIITRYFRPLPGLHVVKCLPAEMVAGSTYEWTTSFINPKSDEGYANITLEITEEETIIGFGEFKVEGFLEAYNIPSRRQHYATITFTEISGGVFQALQTPIGKRFNRLTLKITSVPNLMPGSYTFTLNITISYP